MALTELLFIQLALNTSESFYGSWFWKSCLMVCFQYNREFRITVIIYLVIYGRYQQCCFQWMATKHCKKCIEPYEGRLDIIWIHRRRLFLYRRQDLFNRWQSTIIPNQLTLGTGVADAVYNCSLLNNFSKSSMSLNWMVSCSWERVH